MFDLFKMSERGEKCFTVFPESQVDVLKCLYTNQIYSGFCHRGWNKKTEKLNNNTSVFVELCAYMIPSFSNNVKTQRNPWFSSSRCQRWLLFGYFSLQPLGETEQVRKKVSEYNLTQHKWNFNSWICLPEPHQIRCCLEITYRAFFF